MGDLSPAAAAKYLRLFQTGTPEAFEKFCEVCVKITGGDDSAGHTASVPFLWWPAQRTLAASLCSESEVIVLKPRQMGATWITLAWFLFRSMFKHGHEYRITSVGESEASKALRRVKYMLDNMPDWCSPTLEYSNSTTIKFLDTQSWISALPATQNAGRGDTLNGLLSDEAAFQVYAKEIIKSARPALEKRHGILVVLSTANGVGNHFQEQFVQAAAGQNGYKAHFFSWTADPSRTQKWYDQQLRKHGAEYMHENYPSSAQEAFLASGRPFFSQERLSKDLSGSPPVFHDGFLDRQTPPLRGWRFLPAVQGCLRVWEPPTVGKTYVVGADVSEGLEHKDFSNAYVVDAQDCVEVARVRGRMDVGEFADMLIQVGEWYGSGPDNTPALLVIESNNQGIAVTKHCVDAGYRNLYYEHDVRTGEARERVGWYTSSGQGGTRGVMLGKIQTDYRTGRMHIRDRDCLEEMALFAHRGPRGKPQSPPGKYDDCVMSRAMAHFVSTYEAPSVAEEKEAESSDIRYWVLKDQQRSQEQRTGYNAGLIEMGG